MQSCSETWNLAMNLFTFVAYIISVILFTIICVFHFRSRKDLHPMFVTSFMTILLSYVICDVTAIIYQILAFFNASYVVLNVVYIIYQIFYIYTSPLVVITVLERFCATIYTSSYEFARPWSIFIIAQLISVIVVVIHTLVHIYSDDILMTQLVLLAISIVIMTCLSLLLLVNRRLTLKSRGRCALSQRYQLTENLKALRLLVPAVLLDSMVSLTDVVALVAFDVDYNFEPTKCSSSAVYLPAYIILRTLSIIFEVLIPICLIHRHHAFRRAIERYKARSSSATGPAECGLDKKTLKIKNILGMDITAMENMDHFEALQQHWMKKF